MLEQVREQGFFDVEGLWGSAEFYGLFEAWYADDQRPWMVAAIDTLMEMDRTGHQGTNRDYNMQHGLRVFWGQDGAHKLFADILLVGISSSCLVLPSQTMPFADKQRHTKEIRGVCVSDDRYEEAKSRIWVSEPLDIIPTTESLLVRSDVLEKTFNPLHDADTCIVCDAGRLSTDELELLRCAEWLRYIELG